MSDKPMMPAYGGSPTPYGMPMSDYLDMVVKLGNELKERSMTTSKTAEERAKGLLPCRCHEAYKDRGLDDPDCPWHNYGEDVLDLIIAAQNEAIERCASVLIQETHGLRDGTQSYITQDDNFVVGLADEWSDKIRKLKEETK